MIKQALIQCGLYKPARWIVDNVVSQHRARERKERAALIQSMVPAGSLCFDIGANIGDYSAILLDAGMKVVAVDPQPSTLREIAARFRGNRSITLEATAAGERSGTADFYVGEQHNTSSMQRNWFENIPVGKISVPVTTIDHLISKHGKPHYIKIDVEGFEEAVLCGLHQRIDLISIEYHLVESDVASKLRAISRLQQFGELRFNILPEGSAFTWPTFVPFETFHEKFKRDLDQATSTQTFAYGDIFIRTISDHAVRS